MMLAAATPMGVTIALPAGHDLAQIKGTSMSPTFQPGELVLVDRTVNRIDGEGVFFVHDGLGEAPKRISPGSKVGWWAVYCDDGAFTRHELQPDRIAVTGRIVGVFRLI